jgi:hypothetical protein
MDESIIGVFDRERERERERGQLYSTFLLPNFLIYQLTRMTRLYGAEDLPYFLSVFSEYFNNQ